MNLNNKQRKTLELIFTNPVPANIIWQDIENLFTALGADISQGSGSRVRVKLQQFEIKRGTKMVNFKDVKKRK